MVINHLEKLFVTNDAATIIKELEVVHPAAKILVLASQQQEAEVIFQIISLLISHELFINYAQDGRQYQFCCCICWGASATS